MVPPGSLTFGDGTTVQAVPEACATPALALAMLMASSAAVIPIGTQRAKAGSFQLFIFRLPLGRLVCIGLSQLR